MIKKAVLLILCFLMLSPAVYAKDENLFSGTVKGENIDISITAQGVNVRAFVYTYTVSGAGHSIIHHVEKTDIPSGGTKTIVITPPQEGYSKKLVVAERFMLKPLCKSYVYPYMVNVFAEPLGYTLKDVGTITEGDKTYASNIFEIDAGEFDKKTQQQDVSEASVMRLQVSAAE